MKMMKMYTCEREILIKLILGTELIYNSLQFAVHIENRENGWCEMLVNLHGLLWE